MRSSSGAFAFGAFLALDAFAFELVALFRIDQVDAGAGKHREELFEILGVGGEVRGQQIVHLVVEEVALLLADDDQLPDFIKLIFKRDGHSSELFLGDVEPFIVTLLAVSSPLRREIMLLFSGAAASMTPAPAISMILQAVELALHSGQLTLESDIFRGHHAQIRKHGRGEGSAATEAQEFALPECLDAP